MIFAIIIPPVLILLLKYLYTRRQWKKYNRAIITEGMVLANKMGVEYGQAFMLEEYKTFREFVGGR